MDNSKPIAIRYADELEAHTVTRSQLAESAKLTDGLNAQIADLTSKIEAKDGEIARLTAAAVESESKIVAGAESIAALSAEVESLKGKLAMSPAHISVGGQAAVPDHSGEPEAKSIVEQFAAIKDPAARTAFYKQNAKALWNAAK